MLKYRYVELRTMSQYHDAVSFCRKEFGDNGKFKRWIAQSPTVSRPHAWVIGFAYEKDKFLFTLKFL